MTNWRVESGFPFAPPSYSNQMVGIPLRPELIKGREYLFFTVMFFQATVVIKGCREWFILDTKKENRNTRGGRRSNNTCNYRVRDVSLHALYSGLTQTHQEEETEQRICLVRPRPLKVLKGLFYGLNMAGKQAARQRMINVKRLYMLRYFIQQNT